MIRDSSVGIATGYGLDGSGDRIPVTGEIFFSPHLSRPALGHVQRPIQRVPGLSRGVGVKRPGRGFDCPILAPKLKKV